METPVVPGLVDVEKGIGVNLLVLGDFQTVQSVVGLLGELGVGRSVEFLGVLVGGIVNADTSGQCQPVENLVGKTRAEHIAVLLVDTEVAVVDPIRILHCHAGIAYRPVLGVDGPCRIIALIHPDIFPVISAREEVCAYHRVVIDTLVGHIPVILHNVARCDIEGHPVVKEAGGIAECEIVAVVRIVRDIALGIDSGGGEVSLVLLRSGREGY